jgi:hypothetical protein
MSAAFNAIAIFAVIDVIVKATEKVMEFARKNEEAARKNAEFWNNSLKPMMIANDELELTKTKLENAIAKLEHKPQNMLKEAIEEAGVAADKLGEKLTADLAKIAGALKANAPGAFSQIFLHQKGGVGAASLAEQTQEQLGKAGSESEQREVIRQALLKAAAAQEAAIQMAGRIAENQKGMHLFGGFDDDIDDRAYATESSAARDVAAYAKLIGALQQMLKTADLSAQVEALTNKKGSLEGSVRAGGSAESISGLPWDEATGKASGQWADIRQQALEAALQNAAVAAQEAAEAWKKVQGFTAFPTGIFGSAHPDVVLGKQTSQWKTEMAETLNDWIQKTSSVKLLFAEVWKMTEAMNTELAKAMTGQKTDWAGTFRGEATSLAKMGLERAEGGILGKLGSRGNPMFVKNADAPAGIPGAGGAASAAGGGLLGWLNNSNWASSLFGGSLFGSGSFFGGGHALGGAVAAGVPIDVGEMGRERFTPLVPGRITPNSELRGGGHMFYVDARGASAAEVEQRVQRAIRTSVGASVQHSIAVQHEMQRRRPRG